MKFAATLTVLVIAAMSVDAAKQCHSHHHYADDDIPKSNNGTSTGTGVRCGKHWFHAYRTCGQSCADDSHCPKGQQCFKDLSQVPCGGPLEATDPTKRCGHSWDKANASCGQICQIDADCPKKQSCFGDLLATTCPTLKGGIHHPGHSDSAEHKSYDPASATHYNDATSIDDEGSDVPDEPTDVTGTEEGKAGNTSYIPAFIDQGSNTTEIDPTEGSDVPDEPETLTQINSTTIPQIPGGGSPYNTSSTQVSQPGDATPRSAENSGSTSSQFGNVTIPPSAVTTNSSSTSYTPGQAYNSSTIDETEGSDVPDEPETSLDSVIPAGINSTQTTQGKTTPSHHGESHKSHKESHHGGSHSAEEDEECEDEDEDETSTSSKGASKHGKHGEGSETQYGGNGDINSTSRCGSDWLTAYQSCGKPCNIDDDCEGAKCFRDLSPVPCGGSLPNPDPTSRCGKSWSRALKTKGNLCHIDADCPKGQTCFGKLKAMSA